LRSGIVLVDIFSGELSNSVYVGVSFDHTIPEVNENFEIGPRSFRYFLL
jgi:hypothetical protein